MSEAGEFMARALALAREVQGRTSPNPTVGAVVVKDGRVVGEGRYEGSGTPHAGVAAIADAGTAAHGAMMYVTLEPCSHSGRTSPCTDAILAADIREVHFSHIDPDERVSGRGRAQLEAAGLAVSAGEGEAEARRINEAYLKHRVTGRPFVIAKFAASLDGKIAATSGDSRWVSGPDTLVWSQWLRTRIDAIAVGVGTVLIDNPQLTARVGDPATGEQRLADRQPLRVVLDSRGRTPRDASVLGCGHGPEATGDAAGRGGVLVATTEASSADWRAELAAGGADVTVLPADAAGHVGLPALLDHLGRAGVLTLLVEGGGVLHGSFFDDRLVDKVHAVVAPIIIGGRGAPVAVAGTGAVRMADALRLHQTTVEQLGDDLLVTGYTSDAASAS